MQSSWRDRPNVARRLVRDQQVPNRRDCTKFLAYSVDHESIARSRSTARGPARRGDQGRRLVEWWTLLSRDGQLRHSQDARDQGLVRTRPQVPRSLHSHLGVLAQSGRALVRHADSKLHSAPATSARSAASHTRRARARAARARSATPLLCCSDQNSRS
jgi:hypothetical protein